MKRAIFTLTAIAVIFACGLTHAQEAAAEENVEYDKLKVLEPLIGTWRFERKDDDTGEVRWGMESKVSWSASKKMLLIDVKVWGEDQKATLFLSTYFVWNHKDQRIEFFSFNIANGVVIVSALEPKEKDGALILTFTRIRSLSKQPDVIGRNGRTDKVKDGKWTVMLLNLKDDDGTPLDDMKFEFQKVKPAK